MRGSSLVAMSQVRAGAASGLTAAGAGAADLASQFFAVVDALDSSSALRRAVGDPSRLPEDKAALVADVLTGADPLVVAAVQSVARARWSSDADMVEAVEHLGIDAALTAAQAAGELTQVGAELFAITQALVPAREMRRTLYSDTYHAKARGDLAESLLAGRGTSVTRLLVRRAAESPRGRRFVATLLHLCDEVAERNQRGVATVKTAAPLSTTQRDRLAALLERAYGHAVQVREVIDPEVIGGLRVEVGPEVVDATVLSRLADARRRLAG